MKKINNLMPSVALKNIYDALISPYLIYGILIWGAQGNKLFKIKQIAIRIIMLILSHTDLCALISCTT
jgi:hypothetical protein